MIQCSSLCPDKRIMCVVGDATETVIVDSTTGAGNLFYMLFPPPTHTHTYTYTTYPFQPFTIVLIKINTNFVI